MSLNRAFPLLLLAFSGLLATAQEKAPASDAAPPAKTQLDDASRQVLDKVKANLQSAQTYEYTAKASTKVEGQGMNQEASTTYKVAVKRPNKLLIQCEGGRMDGLVFLCDGEYFYTYSAAEKVFKKEDAPERLVELVEGGYFPSDPLMGFVAAFAEDDPLATILHGVTSGAFVGKEKSGEADAERMHFAAMDEMEWDLWVVGGEKALPARLKPDVTKLLARQAQQAQQMASVKIDMDVAYSDWSFGQELADERFAFKPVEGTKEMSAPKNPLEGEAAPTFSASLLDGARVDLAQHKGKDVVILDFWATWCGPCRQSMPALEGLAEEFKGQNVVLYAVNGGEDAATIQQFLTAEGLAVKAVLDPEHAVSKQYQVSSIPHIVIIGKDGVVKMVQIGFGSGSENRLRKVIKAALSAPNS